MPQDAAERRHKSAAWMPRITVGAIHTASTSKKSRTRFSCVGLFVCCNVFIQLCCLPEFPALFLVLSVGCDRKYQRTCALEARPMRASCALLRASVTASCGSHRDQSSLPRLICTKQSTQPRTVFTSSAKLRFSKLFDTVRVRVEPESVQPSPRTLLIS